MGTWGDIPTGLVLSLTSATSVAVYFAQPLSARAYTPELYECEVSPDSTFNRLRLVASKVLYKANVTDFSNLPHSYGQEFAWNVTGLQSGSRYWIRCRAFNLVRSGPWTYAMPRSIVVDQALVTNIDPASRELPTSGGQVSFDLRQVGYGRHIVAAPFSSFIWNGNWTFPATGCLVYWNGTRAKCTLGPGVGAFHRWVPVFNHVVGLPSPLTSLFAFAAPRVHHVINLANTTRILDSAGSQTVKIQGANFGQASLTGSMQGVHVSQLVKPFARFALRCNITSDHVELTCTTPALFGLELRPIVTIAGQSSQIPHLNTAQPRVLSMEVLHPGLGCQDLSCTTNQLLSSGGSLRSVLSQIAPHSRRIYGLNTHGGGVVRLRGLNFGPHIGSSYITLKLWPMRPVPQQPVDAAARSAVNAQARNTPTAGGTRWQRGAERPLFRDTLGEVTVIGAVTYPSPGVAEGIGNCTALAADGTCTAFSVLSTAVGGAGGWYDYGQDIYLPLQNFQQATDATSPMFTTQQCTVTVAHQEIVCIAPPGYGGHLRVELTISNLPSVQLQSNVSYMAPIVEMLPLAQPVYDPTGPPDAVLKPVTMITETDPLVRTSLLRNDTILPASSSSIYVSDCASNDAKLVALVAGKPIDLALAQVRSGRSGGGIDANRNLARVNSTAGNLMFLPDHFASRRAAPVTKVPASENSITAPPTVAPVSQPGCSVWEEMVAYVPTHAHWTAIRVHGLVYRVGTGDLAVEVLIDSVPLPATHVRVVSEELLAILLPAGVGRRYLQVAVDGVLSPRGKSLVLINAAPKIHGVMEWRLGMEDVRGPSNITEDVDPEEGLSKDLLWGGFGAWDKTEKCTRVVFIGFNFGGLADWQNNYVAPFSDKEICPLVEAARHTRIVCCTRGRDVRFSINVAGQQSNDFNFVVDRLRRKPVVSRVSPDIGPTHGGTNVNLYGKHFYVGGYLEMYQEAVAKYVQTGRELRIGGETPEMGPSVAPAGLPPAPRYDLYPKKSSQLGPHAFGDTWLRIRPYAQYKPFKCSLEFYNLSMVVCDQPAGWGRGYLARVVVPSTVDRTLILSEPRFIRYEPPMLHAVTPKYLPLEGGMIRIHGRSMGTGGAVYIRQRLMYTSSSVPGGVTMARDDLILPDTQQRQYDPVLGRPRNLATADNTLYTMTQCGLISWNHSYIECVAPAGLDNETQVVIDSGWTQSEPLKQAFSYQPRLPCFYNTTFSDSVIEVCLPTVLEQLFTGIWVGMLASALVWITVTYLYYRVKRGKDEKARQAADKIFKAEQRREWIKKELHAGRDVKLRCCSRADKRLLVKLRQQVSEEIRVAKLNLDFDDSFQSPISFTANSRRRKGRATPSDIALRLVDLDDITQETAHRVAERLAADSCCCCFRRVYLRRSTASSIIVRELKPHLAELLSTSVKPAWSAKAASAARAAIQEEEDDDDEPFQTLTPARQLTFSAALPDTMKTLGAQVVTGDKFLYKDNISPWTLHSKARTAAQEEAETRTPREEKNQEHATPPGTVRERTSPSSDTLDEASLDQGSIPSFVDESKLVDEGDADDAGRSDERPTARSAVSHRSNRPPRPEPEKLSSSDEAPSGPTTGRASGRTTGRDSRGSDLSLGQDESVTV